MKVKKTSLSLIAIESFFVLLSCCDIAYLNYLGGYISVFYWLKIGLLGLRLGFVCIFTLNILLKKNKFSKTFGLITLLFVLLSFISIIRTFDIIIYTITTLSKPYLIVLYIQKYWNEDNKIERILKSWKKILFFLCFIDFVTLIVYPNGMFREKNYVHNWFLGYKTARLVYSWPLLIITSYLDFSESKENKKNISKATYITFGMCIFNAIKSKATGASTALIIYAVMIYFIRNKHNEKNSRKWYRIFNAKNIGIVGLIMYYLVLMIESNYYMQRLIENIFEKSATLSNRTGIWENCIDFFCESPIWGHGLFTTAEYIYITNYYLGTNAHNLLLTILISGGIFALIIYFMIYSVSMKRSLRVYSKKEVALIISIISFIVLGLTSSALVFSPFAFFPFILLEKEKERKNLYEKINYEK